MKTLFFSLLACASLLNSGHVTAKTPVSIDFESCNSGHVTAKTPISIDFESCVVGEVIHFPWKIGPVTFSAVDKEFFLEILDQSSYLNVLGPRSMGIFTSSQIGNGPTRFLKVTFESPQQWIYLSMIKVADGATTYTLRGKDGSEVGKGALVFSRGALGSYQTFSVRATTNDDNVKEIDFGGGTGFLARISATSSRAANPEETNGVCAGNKTANQVVVDVLTDHTRCNRSANDVWVLEDVGQNKAGDQISICAFDTVPNGWLTIDYKTDHMHCGTPGSDNNIRIIQKQR